VHGGVRFSPAALGPTQLAHDAIADLPIAHRRPRGDHHSGWINPWYERQLHRPCETPGARQYIEGAVHGDRMHADKNFVRTGFRSRDIFQPQHRWRTEFADDDRLQGKNLPL
jgi:hypothetical protein